MARNSGIPVSSASLVASNPCASAAKNISCVNIAPGPIATDRLKNLVSDMAALEARLPFGRVGKVEELAKFVRSIVENDIKYLTGVTINFDGGHNSYVL